MDKLKNILSPGKNKDDEVLYNQGSSTAQTDAGSGSYNAGVPHGTSEAPQLHTLPQDQKEHGVMRQILNPGGEKYDITAHGGSSATTDARHASVAHEQSGTNQPKEHGILRQIFNPGNEKYDPALYQGSDDVLATNPAEGERIPGSLATGSSAQHIQSGEQASKSGGVLRQILNPGGDKYDGQGFDPTGTVGSGSSTNAPTSGSTAPTHDSHTARDVAGAGAVGAGAGALAHHEAGRDRAYDQTTSGRSGALDSTTGTTTTSRTAPQHTTTTTTTTSYNQAPAGSTSGYGATGQSTSNAPSTHGTGHAGRDASYTVGAVGLAGLAAHEHARHESHTSNPTSSQTYESSHQPISGAYESSADPASQRGTTGGAGYGSTGPQSTAGYGSTGPQSTTVYGNTGSQSTTGYGSTTSDSQQHHHHHHHGAETAAVGTGAVAAGGIAAHEHNKHSATPAAQSGLSHHVHNGVTEPAHSNHGHHSFTGTRSGGHSTSNANEPTPFHATPAATFSHSEHSGSGGVYNTVTGKHSAHEPEHHHGSHHSHGHSGAATGAGVGAATGLAGASLADRTRAEPSGTTTGAPAYESSSRQVPGAFPGETSHGYGATGTTGGTAGAALAAQEAIKRHETQQSSAPYSSTSGAQRGVPAGSYGTDPSQTSTGHSQHHYGRDAALGAGAGAATGTGLYEAEKHHHGHGSSATSGQTHTPQSSGTTSQSTSSTTGPHSSSLLNKLDPRVKNDQSSTEPHHSHTGRDAAIGTGAGAATGAGIYEAEKHHHGNHGASTSSGYGSSGQQTSNQGYSSGTTSQSTSNTTGPHSSSLLNKLDPRVKSEQTASEPHRGHAGRDAAIGTGAGAATGAGIYEAEKHHGHHGHHQADTGYGSTSTTGAGYGTATQAPSTSTSQHGYPEKSHTGRDAALVGGAGAATGAGVYETEKHHGHHGHHNTAQTANTQSSSGVHHDSALLNKLDPRVKNDSTAQDTQHSQHAQHSHHGRDAAVGTGAGAATGAGVYEAEKHHHAGSSQAGYGTEQTSGSYAGYGSETTAPHRSEFLNKLDPRVPNDATTTGAHQQGQHSHTGRDAALVGGAGAATGAGIYEAEKHHGAHSQTGPSSTTGYGQSTQTGPSSTTGYNQSGTGYAQTEAASKTAGSHVQHDPSHAQTSGRSHEGRDVAAGVSAGTGAGYAAHEAHEHEKKHHHGPMVREDENHHNKLHKEPKEKKEGFLHKLLHPGSKKEGDIDSPTHSSGTSSTAVGYETTGHTTGQTTGQTIDPHTGLPINTQYGTGQGGTDAASNIAGYQQGSSVQGTDWEKIGKQNTPY
ncbi:hypothetical protein AMS68_001697 [Peltaster fructicola]|uniref:Uncharacterized protein n=1 Tax=Peltaster fructicola TaxID=286661 RepID=A0A6H0XNW5_9PEZI|nr:hypothetical protein AMS68_001697 [Peltaster fructicola]